MVAETSWLCTLSPCVTHFELNALISTVHQLNGQVVAPCNDSICCSKLTGILQQQGTPRPHCLLPAFLAEAQLQAVYRRPGCWGSKCFNDNQQQRMHRLWRISESYLY